MQRSNCAPPKDYADHIVRQIEQLRTLPYLRDLEYESVYFGGGTPTVLDTKQMRKILRALHDSFRLLSNAEISVESSISELSDEKLDMLREEGVNRLSIGIQTFSDRGRRLLGRRGTGDYAANRLESILASGFFNTSIDLIYNYPEQTVEELKSDIARVLALDIAGLSYYSLMLSDDSALARRMATDETAYAQATLERDYESWHLIHRMLCDNGFEILELTKLVRPGRDDYRYIRVRQENGDTLPLGAGAGGRIGNLLLHIPADAAHYAALLDQPLECQYHGRLVGDTYNFISRQIGKLQLCYLDSEGTPAWSEDAFAEIRDFMLSNGLGDRDDRNPGRLLLNTQGIFWGNNIANRYADMLVRQALGHGNPMP